MLPRTLRWRVHVLLGAVVLLLLVTVAATALGRLRVSDLNGQLRWTLRPAQASSAALSKAYVDMETGVRGFLLSGESELLAPYRAGRDAARTERASLGRLLADDPTARTLLTEIDRAAAEWERTLATPALRGELTAQAAGGMQGFDELRAPLAALQKHVDDRTNSTNQAAAGASTLANFVTIVCACLVLLVGGVIIVLVQRSLVRPVNQLVANVRRVADGDLSHRVLARGPAEVITLSAAVEQMRERILRESSRAARMEEADRIAEDLGATTVRDLFSISLALHSTAARHPSAAPALTVVTSDVDRVLQEIRTRVFNDARSVHDVLAGMDLDPNDDIPDVPAPADLDPFLRDVLPLLPSATLQLAEGDATLWTHITGPPPEDLTQLKDRATQHNATVTTGHDRVTVEWSAPL